MLVQNNTPSVGYITWSGVKITYKGVTHTIANGNTNLIYVYWKYNDPDGFYGSNTYPTLGPDDLLVFLNKNGTHLKVPNTTILDGSLIVPESILTDALSANSVTAEKILAGTISATEIAAGAIGTNQLAADSVISSKILAGTIVSTDIASRTIAADRLVANSITAGEIASRTIIANDIATGTLTANEIAAGTITGDKLIVDAITGREIKAGAITTNHIATVGLSADVIKGGTISGITISGVTINTTGSKGTITMSADTIKANSNVWESGLSGGEVYASALSGITRITPNGLLIENKNSNMIFQMLNDYDQGLFLHTNEFVFRSGPSALIGARIDEYAVRVKRLDGIDNAFIIPLSGNASIDTTGTQNRIKSGPNYMSISEGSEGAFFLFAGANNYFSARLASDGHTLLKNGATGFKFISANATVQVRNSGDTAYGNLVANEVAYQTIRQFSDRRLKKDIMPYEKSASDVIESIKIYEYNYKNGGSTKRIGAIHDEAPDWIRVDGTDDEPETNSIDTTNLTWLNTKSIQEILRILKNNNLS